jgi:hypothetical protein
MTIREWAGPCLTVAFFASSPCAAQKGPVELNWATVGPPRAQILTRTGIQLAAHVNQAIGAIRVDIASVGQGTDTSATGRTLNLRAGETTYLRETLVAPLNASGRLFLVAAGVDSAGIPTRSLTEVPYQVRNGVVQLGKQRSMTNLAHELPVTLGLSTLPGARINGFTGTARIKSEQITVLQGAPQNTSLKLTAAGAVTILNNREVEASQTSADNTHELHYAIPANERGIITAEFKIVDENGRARLIRRSSFYLLSDGQQLYTGSSGFIALEHQRLQARLASRQISKGEYDRLLRELVSRGAQATIRK